jgi:hypothetical protein
MKHLTALSIQHMVLPLLERIHIHLEMQHRGGNLQCTELDVVTQLIAIADNDGAVVRCCLDKLDLHGAAAAWLAKALTKNTQLKCLELNACKLTDDDVANILLGAARHPKLRELV